MTRPFKGPWWLPSGHLQTLWPSLFRHGPRPALVRERFKLSDGDFVDLDWGIDPIQSGPPRPTVAVLHGLEGSSESSYAWGCVNAALALGWNALVVHFRGCSGEPNLAPRRYHSGETEDIAEVISDLASRQAVGPLMAVGFSLGGNVLLKWLGEQRDRAPLDAAAAICVPLNLGRCADRLERGFSRFYQWWLMRSMRASVDRQFRGRDNVPINLEAAAATRTFREFDDVVTAPLHGFSDAEDYYQRCSSRQFLGSISVPTLVLQARDDPFMYPDVLPTPDELSPTVTLETPASGGHVGFVTGPHPWRPTYWHEVRTFDFLSATLKDNTST